MTTTTAPPTEANAEVTDPDAVGGPARPATLVDLDPRALSANPANIRSNLGDLGPLAASIAAVGVLEPLVVIPDGDGGHRIVAGHRRNQASILAGKATVPCLVRPDLAANATATVVAMIVENTHRLDLAAHDEARAYQQLALTGLSPAKIAKRVGHKPAHVKKAAVGRMAAGHGTLLSGGVGLGVAPIGRADATDRGRPGTAPPICLGPAVSRRRRARRPCSPPRGRRRGRLRLRLRRLRRRPAGRRRYRRRRRWRRRR